VDATLNELDRVFDKSDSTLQQYLTKGPGDTKEVEGFFEVRKLMSELYRKTAKAKVGTVENTPVL